MLKHLGVKPFNPPDTYDVNLLRGDHLVKLKVKFPTNMTEKQKQLMQEFQKIENQSREKFYAGAESKFK